MQNSRRRGERPGVVLCAVAAAAFGLAGCSSKGNEPEPEPGPETQLGGSAVLTDRARVLDSAGAAALGAIEGNGSVLELTFSGHSEVLDRLAAGDVLVVGVTGETPDGALLAIDEVVEAGAGFAVRAHPAKLGDAFEELKIHVKTSLQLAAPVARDHQRLTGAERLHRSQQAVGVSVPLDISTGSGANSLSLAGSVALDADPKLELDIDFAKLKLKELSLRVTGKETFVARITGRGSSSFDEVVHLWGKLLKPLVFTIPLPGVGALPVVITPKISLDAGVKGSIAGDAEIGVTQRASFTVGLGYVDGEFKTFSEDASDFDTDDPRYTASASIRAWAGPKLEVLLYGAVGPFAGVQGFVEASASVEGVPPCITGAIDAGLSATAGVSFLADYSTTLFEERYRLAGFDSCNPDIDGPDAATTWARVYRRAGSPGERAQAVVQASDGGYLLVGQSDLFDGVTGFAASTWVLRLDALGNVLWQRAFQRTRQGLARAAAEVPGGFVVVGNSGLLRLDSGGNLLWAKQYEAKDGVELMSAAAREDGSLVLAGALALAGRSFGMQVNPQGDVVWSRSFAGEDFRRVRATSDGGSVLAGMHSRSNGDFYVVKLDAGGMPTWQRALDNRHDRREGVEGATPEIVSSIDTAYDVIERPGGFVVVGESYGSFPIPEATPVGYYASAELALGPGGELVTSTLSRAPREALYGAAYGVAVRPNGSTLVVARGASEASDLLTGEDVLLIQGGAFSALGGAGNDAVYSGALSGVGRGMPLQITRDGGAALAVTSDSFTGQDQVWLLKLSRTGSINSPLQRSLSGTSYVNKHATSFALDLPVSDVAVEVQTFTAEVRSEVTEAVSPTQ